MLDYQENVKLCLKELFEKSGKYICQKDFHYNFRVWALK